MSPLSILRKSIFKLKVETVFTINKLEYKLITKHLIFNSFPPPEVKGENSISWLYDALAEEWSYWLPEDALKTLR